ncbi:MAG: hypothetical protein HY907_16890 [Deltaproteobacteria bacterium]|nr:hypothetical protein [Deltaproteobacteria bacterium]
MTSRGCPAVVLALAIATLPSGSDARMADAYFRVPATYVPVYYTYLEVGRDYRFEVRPTTEGAMATIHLLKEGTDEVTRGGVSRFVHPAYPDTHPVLAYTELEYHNDDGTGWYLVVIRAANPSSSGVADIGLLLHPYDTWDSIEIRRDVPFGGTHVRLPWDPADPGDLRLHLVPSTTTSCIPERGSACPLLTPSTPDPALFVLAPGGTLAFYDNDGGPGLTSELQAAGDASGYVAIVASAGPDQIGTADLFINDYHGTDPRNDTDGDGLGNELEKILRTCPDNLYVETSGRAPLLDCRFVPGPRDTDTDGIFDADEVLGVAERAEPWEPPLHLRLWGASPRHKDVFAEVDWCLDDNQVALDIGRCRGPLIDDNRMHLIPDDAQVVAGVYARLPAWDDATSRGVRNPDGARGVTAHFDIGETCPWGWACGNWGGANCLSRDVRDGDKYRCPSTGDGERFTGNLAENRKPIFHWGGTPGGRAAVNGQTFGPGGRDATSHELGHNLNLQHWGDARTGFVPVRSRTQCKPSYLSIMSYLFSGDMDVGFSEGTYVGHPIDSTALLESRSSTGLGSMLQLGDFQKVNETFFTRGRGTRPPFCTPPCTPDPPYDLDWNRDGEISLSPVVWPANYAPAGCATFSIGRVRHMDRDVVGTPQILEFSAYGDNYYYIFYSRGEPGSASLNAALWPADRFVEECGSSFTGADACMPPGGRSAWIDWGAINVGAVAAERTQRPDGSWAALVVFDDADPLRRGPKWTIGTPQPLMGVPMDFTRPEYAAASFLPDAALDVELERASAGRIFLAVTDGLQPGTGQVNVQLYLEDSQSWFDLGPAVTPTGDPVTTETGVALAYRPGYDDLFMLVAPMGFCTTHDAPAIGPQLRIFRFDESHNEWVPDYVMLDGTQFPCSAMKPTLIWRPEPTHDRGGWFVMVHREKAPPDKAQVDYMGLVDLSAYHDCDGDTASEICFVPGHAGLVSDNWTSMPDYPLTGVGLYLRTDGRGMVGAFPWREEQPDHSFRWELTFLPRADGIAETRLGDNDDAGSIGFGVCVSLWRYSPSIRCGPLGSPPPDVETGVVE